MPGWMKEKQQKIIHFHLDKILLIINILQRVCVCESEHW